MLKDEIKAGESSSLEFKREVPKDHLKFLKTVVAFANGSGGRILFGVNNDRTVFGVDEFAAFKIADSVADTISNRCKPLIAVNTDVTSVDGKTVVIIEVQQGKRCPYFIQSLGKEEGTFVRVGATTRLADETTIRELEFAGAGHSFDEEICPELAITERDAAKLCARMFRIAKENCKTDAERKALRKVTTTQLEDWGILTRSGKKLAPTYAYALLSGWRKFGGLVQCGVFRGKTKAIFVDNREYSGSVIDQIDLAYEYLLSKIFVGLEIVGTKSANRYEIPLEALRELVINAIVHRSYVNPRAMSVQIALFDDRLEITTPGGLPHGMSVDMMRKGHSIARNRALALACKYMRIIESWGSGIPRIDAALVAEGLKPLDIEDNGIDLRLIVWRKTQTTQEMMKEVSTSPKTAQETAQETAVLPKTTQENTQEPGKKDCRTQKIGDRILELVRTNPKITTSEMARVLGLTRYGVNYHLRAMKTKGILRREGATKNGRWVAII